VDARTQYFHALSQLDVGDHFMRNGRGRRFLVGIERHLIEKRIRVGLITGRRSAHSARNRKRPKNERLRATIQ
jgi:hypothetical protein